MKCSGQIQAEKGEEREGDVVPFIAVRGTYVFRNQLECKQPEYAVLQMEMNK